jgi:6-pyruvoyltetrahydropterin/6-carboxytetrahydropterin synthase
MYELAVRSSFSAAHRLIDYQGKCENLHGHNWKVEAKVVSEKLDKRGMVIDFKKIKQGLKQVLDRLDHTYLNELKYFKDHSPTSEHIARYIYLELASLIKKNMVTLKEVTVWETDNSSATYRPE